MTLSEFLLARIADDEAAPPPNAITWTMLRERETRVPAAALGFACPTCHAKPAETCLAMTPPHHAPQPARSLHATRCDLARAELRRTSGAERWAAECDAKRRIVEMHEPANRCGGEEGWEEFAADYKARYGYDAVTHYPRGYCHGCDGCSSAKDADRDAWATLKLIALPYADHLDYREEWKP